LFHQANATAARRPGGPSDPADSFAMVRNYRLDDPVPPRSDEDPPEDRDDAYCDTDL
jgi:hypothetical protein